jgi:hypothetical protein
LESPDEDGKTRLTTMLRVCQDARNGGGWQRIKMLGGVGFKRPRPRWGCRVMGDEEEIREPFLTKRYKKSTTLTII